MNSTKIKLFSVGLCAVLSSSVANARDANVMLSNPQAIHHSNGAYVSLFSGFGWTHSGKTTNLLLTSPLLTNRYEASTVSRDAVVVGVGAGYIKRWSHTNLLLGVETGYTRVLSAPGLVRPMYLADPGLDTLDFRYVVSSLPLLVVSTLQFPQKVWTPYVLAGAGVSWNRASDYQETPTNPNGTAVAMRSPFRPRTTLNFAYTVGVGFSCALSARVDWGLEYRYTCYGSASLNTTLQQSTSNRLSLGTISSHAILLRLSVS